MRQTHALKVMNLNADTIFIQQTVWCAVGEERDTLNTNYREDIFVRSNRRAPNVRNVSYFYVLLIDFILILYT